MAPPPEPAPSPASTKARDSLSKSWFSKFLSEFGWDFLLGSIAAFYVIAVPYTKVEESFNIQAMHDILYHHHHIAKYDHLEFPGVVPRSFIGAILLSILASPMVAAMHILHVPKLYSLVTVRLALGCIILMTMRIFRIQVRRKFGYHVEAFFSLFSAVQFHVLFYSTRPLPNIFAFGLVNLAYSFWFKGNFLGTLRCLTIATVVFRCDIALLFGPIGLEILLSKSVRFWEAFRCCLISSLLCIGVTVLIDSVMWKKILWPELEVFWFNTVLNRSSEWGTHAFHWYFTSALPRALLVAYPFSVVGMTLDRRILRYTIPVFTFLVLYSKLPHKELRFIIGVVPIFNVSAAIGASRLYTNRRKSLWRWIYFLMLGSMLLSLGFSVATFMASYNNYPSAYALKALHRRGKMYDLAEKTVHIDSFSAMNGISRFCEIDFPWRYSKEEDIKMDDYVTRNFTFLLNERSFVRGYKCLFAVNGFSKARLQIGLPPLLLVKEPRVFVHGRLLEGDFLGSTWPGCP